MAAEPATSIPNLIQVRNSPITILQTSFPAASYFQVKLVQVLLIDLTDHFTSKRICSSSSTLYFVMIIILQSALKV